MGDGVIEMMKKTWNGMIVFQKHKLVLNSS